MPQGKGRSKGSLDPSSRPILPRSTSVLEDAEILQKAVARLKYAWLRGLRRDAITATEALELAVAQAETGRRDRQLGATISEASLLLLQAIVRMSMHPCMLCMLPLAGQCQAAAAIVGQPDRCIGAACAGCKYEGGNPAARHNVENASPPSEGCVLVAARACTRHTSCQQWRHKH
jgi:hypothetical protein